jgi:hypothetical protein
MQMIERPGKPRFGESTSKLASKANGTSSGMA